MTQDAGKEPFAVVTELATNSVNLTVYFWATTESYRKGILKLQSRVMNRIRTRLSAEGYSFPSNIVELQYPAAPLQVATAPAGPLALAPVPAQP